MPEREPIFTVMKQGRRRASSTDLSLYCDLKMHGTHRGIDAYQRDLAFVKPNM